MGVRATDTERIDANPLFSALGPRSCLDGDSQALFSKRDWPVSEIYLRPQLRNEKLTFRVWLIELDVWGDCLVLKC